MDEEQDLALLSILQTELGNDTWTAAAAATVSHGHAADPSLDPYAQHFQGVNNAYALPEADGFGTDELDAVDVSTGNVSGTSFSQAAVYDPDTSGSNVNDMSGDASYMYSSESGSSQVGTGLISFEELIGEHHAACSANYQDGGDFSTWGHQDQA